MTSTTRTRTLTSYYRGEPTTVAADTGLPTSQPTAKVVASTAGAAVGAAVSTIAVYLIETLGRVDLPIAVEGAGLVLISAGVAYLSGWIKRP